MQAPLLHLSVAWPAVLVALAEVAAEVAALVVVAEAVAEVVAGVVVAEVVAEVVAVVVVAVVAALVTVKAEGAVERAVEVDGGSRARAAMAAVVVVARDVVVLLLVLAMVGAMSALPVKAMARRDLLWLPKSVKAASVRARRTVSVAVRSACAVDWEMAGAVGSAVGPTCIRCRGPSGGDLG